MLPVSIEQARRRQHVGSKQTCPDFPLLKMKLKSEGGEEEEEPSPPPLFPLSLSLPLPAPCSTIKPCDFNFSSAFIVSVILAWLSQKNVFEILWSKLTRFITTRLPTIQFPRVTWIRGNVSWRNLPPELCEEIGKRIKSRLDIVHFRSVCKKWRSPLPSPTRFPLHVPPLPNCYEPFHNYPSMITEVNYYCVDITSLVALEEVGQGGNFRPITIYGNSFKDLLEHLLFKLSFVSKAYHLRFYEPVWDSHAKYVVEGEWNVKANKFAKKVAIISANATDGVNPSYAKASDLSVVAHLACGDMAGRLALLRLGGSPRDWVWDTGFCTDVFDDIGTYRGQLCTIDPSGNVFLMDYNSLQMTRIAPPLPSFYLLLPKYLFEAFGDLYLATTCGLETYKFSFQLQTWIKVVDKAMFDFFVPFLVNV